MKLIREGRFGSPKQYKTGAVVSTYPKPLLVINFDEAGLDVIKDPVLYIKPTEIERYAKMKVEELPPIIAIDFCDIQRKELTVTYQATASSTAFEVFVQFTNAFIKLPCPWKTVVVDSITGLTDQILSHIAKTNFAAMADARKWAGNVGLKMGQIVGV